jgi:hypothetical protein
MLKQNSGEFATLELVFLPVGRFFPCQPRQNHSIIAVVAMFTNEILGRFLVYYRLLTKLFPIGVPIQPLILANS